MSTRSKDDLESKLDFCDAAYADQLGETQKVIIWPSKPRSLRFDTAGATSPQWSGVFSRISQGFGV